MIPAIEPILKVNRLNYVELHSVIQIAKFIGMFSAFDQNFIYENHSSGKQNFENTFKYLSDMIKIRICSITIEFCVIFVNQ